MDGLITVDVHHRGIFRVNPILFLDADVIKVNDVNFGTKDFESFHTFLKELLRDPCHRVYYCIPRFTLILGLRKIQNDIEYQKFLEHAYDSGKINVYVDTFLQDMTKYLVDDVQLYESSDNAISDDESVDHEEDEEVIKFKSNCDDDFSPELVLDKDYENVSTSEGVDGSVYPTFNPSIPWNEMEPVVGMKFVDCKQMKDCLTNYVVANGYGIYYEKNTFDKLLVRCGDRHSKDKCTFRLWATWMTNYEAFQIKTLVSEHCCSKNYSLGSLVTYNWIANKYAKQLLANPGMSIRALQQDVKEKFNLKVSVSQCQRAKKEAIGEIESKLIKHYGLLWSYAEELRRSNPGSTVKLDVVSMPDGKNYFKSYYVCLKELKDGWIEGCRKVIGVDGAFLKGICTGELLSAVGRDSNNQLYPLAWVVVAVENKESWTWFLELLEGDIGLAKGCGLTLLSDGHKGLAEAVKDILPGCEHRLCGRHIYANLTKKFKGPNYKKMFWAAAKATTPVQFEKKMQKIKTFNVQAYTYLMEREPKSWSRAFFEVGRQCDACENGICESFNAAVADARRKPILTMLEEIRLYVMERISAKYAKGNRWKGPICPKVKKKFDKVKKKHSFWDVIPSGFQKFETRNGDQGFSVDLIESTCSCRSWQLKGIPCRHACAAMSHINKNPDTYISHCFSKDVYLRTYSHNINPLNGKDMWHVTTYIPPLPPKVRRMPGRPAIKRRRGETEREEMSQKHSVSRKGTIITCSLCKARGHNKSTCPNLRKEDHGTNNTKEEGEKGASTSTNNGKGQTDTTKDEQVQKVRKKQRLPVLLQESEEETVVPETEEEVNEDIQEENQGFQDLFQDTEDFELNLEDVMLGYDESGTVREWNVNVEAVDGESDGATQMGEDLATVDGEGDGDIHVVEDVASGPKKREKSAANVGRTRKPSERITKLKIRRPVVGAGSSIMQPMDLD